MSDDLDEVSDMEGFAMHKIRAFLAVADCGSFSKAAKTLYVTPQALMKTVNSLEKDVGGPLLERNAQGIKLLGRGREFYKTAQKILDEYEGSINRLKSADWGDDGVIRVAALDPGFINIVTQAFQQLKKRSPHVTLTFLEQHDERAHLQLVKENVVDLCENIKVPGSAVKGIEYLELYDQETHCFVHPSHPLAKRDSVRLEELSDWNVYLWSPCLASVLTGNYEESDLSMHMIEQSTAMLHGSLDLRRVVLEKLFAGVYTACANDGVFVHLEGIGSLFPELQSVPLKKGPRWICEMGYSQKPSPLVSSFVDVVREMLSEDPAFRILRRKAPHF